MLQIGMSPAPGHEAMLRAGQLTKYPVITAIFQLVLPSSQPTVCTVCTYARYPCVFPPGCS